MGINGNISDLFFNLDHSESIRRPDRGSPAVYDRDSMLATASWLVATLEDLGMSGLPTPDAIVDDFAEEAEVMRFAIDQASGITPASR